MRIFLAETKFLARRNQNFSRNEVDAGDHLGDRCSTWMRVFIR